MKNPIKEISMLAAMMAAASFVYAQNQVPGALPPAPAALNAPVPPGPPMANAEPRRGKEPKGAPRPLTVLTTISGKVVAYVANDRSIYNAFTLQTGSQTITVRFPEHLGSQLMDEAKKGETITVNGFTENDPQGGSIFRLVSAKAGGKQIIDTPPASPVAVAAPELKNYEGTISDLKKDAKGNVNGIILNSKEVIETPPHVMAQLQSIVKTGEKVAVTGFKVIPRAGVVMATERTIINPQTITLNGQTYLVR